MEISSPYFAAFIHIQCEVSDNGNETRLLFLPAAYL